MFNKKIICLLICFVFLFLTACSGKDEPEEVSPPQGAVAEIELKGIWLSCYEISHMLSEGSKKAFEEQAQIMLDKCTEEGIGTVFFHVRAFCDSVYPSDYFPFSKYALSSKGEVPDFDVLEAFIALAQQRSISVHAWINPYRVSYETGQDNLADDSIALNEKYKSCIRYTDLGVYLDPSSLLSQSLVLGGVREILENYDVEGIHIDDYFYPVTDESFDEASYDEYRENGGRLNLSSWRRENINALVSSIYSLVHSYQGVIFSISPAGDISKNKNKLYADVELWLRSEGYADLIIPQLYYGFENEEMPFEKVAKKWSELERSANVSLVSGLALYKQGKVDDLAGSGSNEWVNNSDIILRQMQLADTLGYSGYVFFSYVDL